ncbi:ion channel [Rivularia sp. UHCC 0363]|uniref:ion channel n=1 Tax=Rivularia sp. UHCC 0363 TaxID=3110244 RepID=UPI002B1FC746|nr:ion channel [Rivularia sp. UHCC 0363]MEA5592767.1 ion channel [Rivularia sp. UHCC 0363]
MQIFSKLGSWRKKAVTWFKRQNSISKFGIIFLITIIFFCIVGVVISNIELNDFCNNDKKKKNNFWDSFWWIIVTASTVGYGDCSPKTSEGRIIAYLVIFVAAILLPTINSLLSNQILEKYIREEFGMAFHDNIKEHIILCEWNCRSKKIIENLRSNDSPKIKPIVIISEIDTVPIKDFDQVFLVKGKLNSETLNRANLAKAKTVIILGDDNLDDLKRDAQVVIYCSILGKKLEELKHNNPKTDIYTIVELVNQEYADSCKKAGANEVIVSHHLNSNLIASAITNHGISNVITDILDETEGSRLFKRQVPKFAIDKSLTFIELFTQMKEKDQSTIIAIQHGHRGKTTSNPPRNYEFKRDDYLIILASYDKSQFFKWGEEE